jgi:hypothetical protein
MRATWTRQIVGIAVGAFCALALGAAAEAQAPDPLIGTWKLDAAKSTYKPGPAPKSVTVVIEPGAGQAIKVAVDVVPGEGAPMKMGYTSLRDGKDAPVTGNPGYDTVAITQTSPTEGTIVYKSGGKPAMTAKTSVSKDGKTLTVTYSGTGPKGQAINNVVVYTKQ